MRQENSNLNNFLFHKAEKNSDKDAYIFLLDGEEESSRLTYKDLATRAKLLASHFQSKNLAGERATLMYQSGPEYIIALWACILANIIAIPVYPPRNSHHARRLQNIINDADAKIVLTDSEHYDSIKNYFSDMSSEVACIIATTEIKTSDSSYSQTTVSKPNDIAYLQYTSGSTGNPKGVMVSHNDVIRNCQLIAQAVDLEADQTHVNWLPLYHDMGMIQGVMMPFSIDCTSVIIPPVAFTQRPARWLKAISKYRAVYSGGPNFAYQLCVDRINENQITDIDLSHWTVAVNGAEPIIPDTLEKFTQRFEEKGFNPKSHHPAFGMAEATLFVTLTPLSRGAKVLSFDLDSLQNGKVVLADEQSEKSTKLVSCGSSKNDPEIIIVHPDTNKLCKPDQVGEIWVAGSSICQGYWNRPEATKETFGGQVNIQEGEPATSNTFYMRTGDLGFIYEGELFFASRLKELVVIRGVNHYPQDIEKLSQTAHPSINTGNSGAVFSIENDDSQELVLVQEVARNARKNFDASEISNAIVRVIAEAHGVEISTIVFINPASLPVTSSGKIQRRLCKKLYLDNELKPLAIWSNPATKNLDNTEFTTVQNIDTHSLQTILQKMVAAKTGLKQEQIDINSSFKDYGLDSLRLTELVENLGDQLGLDLKPTVIFRYPTIKTLSSYLCGVQQKNEFYNNNLNNEAIAVIGFDCRVPGAKNAKAFWQMLLDGQQGIIQTPKSRWDNDYFYSKVEAQVDKMHTRWGGFLEDVDKFDADFFDITRREAESMDPQQRMLLETSWHALEAAGQAPDKLKGSRTGVFVGICNSDYATLKNSVNAGKDAYSGTGNALSIAANRLSYFYDFRGPSLAIDTACSSSLVAIDHACKSLRTGESNLAIAGGVNLILSPENTIIFSQARMMSPSGRCHTFSDDADGYVRGEGCGVMILKRLSDAERDGDNIISVICGSAVNQDGKSNGLSAPNGEAQRQVITQALKNASIDSKDIDYIESHGTGTPLGDPIEMESIKEVLDSKQREKPVYVGALKTNIGHLEAAAGILSAIKASMVVSEKTVPCNLNFSELNSKIDLSTSNVKFPNTTKLSDKNPSIASINSFGFGGTNANLILKSYQASPTHKSVPSEIENNHHFIALSANSLNSMKRLLEMVYRDLQNLNVSLKDYCFSINTTRSNLVYRAIVEGTSAQDLSNKIAHEIELIGSKQSEQLYRTSRKAAKTAFMFPGQGCQYTNMAKSLYETDSLFKEILDRCAVYIEKELEVGLTDLLFDESQSHLLNQTKYSQGAIFSVEYALAELWQSWGVEPDFTIGHSVGEYVAACISGVFSLEDALKLLCTRSKLIDSCATGAMLSVVADEKEIFNFLDSQQAKDGGVAATNGPKSIVISGTNKLIEQAQLYFSSRGIQNQKLNVSHAFHSVLLEPILDEFYLVAKQVTYSKPTIPIISNVTGDIADESICTPEYWTQHIRKPVSFCQGMKKLGEQNISCYIEIGPEPILIALAKYFIEQPDSLWLPSIRKKRDDWQQLDRAVSKMFTEGVSFDFSKYYERRDCRRVSIPTYPFDHKTYWISKSRAVPQESLHGFSGRRIKLATRDESLFECEISINNPSYIKNHKVFGEVIFPGAGYVELALTALEIYKTNTPVELTDILISKPLYLNDEPILVHTYIEKDPERNISSFKIYSFNKVNDDWTLHASGGITREPIKKNSFSSDDHTKEICLSDFYNHWDNLGLNYTAEFKQIVSIHVNSDENSACAEIHNHFDSEQHMLHPAVLDMVFQTSGALLKNNEFRKNLIPVPIKIESVNWVSKPKKDIHVIARRRSNAYSTSKAQDFTFDIDIFSDKQDLCCIIKGLKLALVHKDTIKRRSNNKQCIYSLAWQPFVQSKSYREESESFADWSIIYSDQITLDNNLLVISYPHLRDNAASIHDVKNKVSSKKILETSNILIDIGNDRLTNIDEFYSLLAGLFDVLSACSKDDSINKIVFLTHGILDRNTIDVKNLGSAISALVKSFSQENIAKDCLHIDLPAQADKELQEKLIDHLLVPNIKANSLRIVDDSLTLAEKLVSENESYDLHNEISSSASYLITGGLGALGLETAQVLSENGAGTIILCSRRAVISEEDERIQALKINGSDVIIHEIDITDLESVKALFAKFKQSLPELKGIVHAAGTLRDGAIKNQDWETWKSVFDAKVIGTMNLHECSSKLNLDFFTCYSSIASVFGSSGQTNYATANGFMDAITQQRISEGLPSTVINWGPWSEIGMAHKNNVLRTMEKQGIRSISPSFGRKIIGNYAFLTSGQYIVIDANWNRVSERVPNSYDLIKELITTKESVKNIQADNLVSDISTAMNENDQMAVFNGIYSYLHHLLNKISYFEKEIDKNFSQLRMSELGLDSLMAMEINNQLQKNLTVKLPVSYFIGEITIKEVAQVIYENLLMQNVTKGNQMSETPITDNEEFEEITL